MTGCIFQNLKVLGPAPNYVSSKGKHDRMWRCECLLCGKEIVTRQRSLTSGHIKSCGKKHRKVEDLTGRDFYNLHVIERADNVISTNGSSYVMWKCVCKCGNVVTVRGSSLKNGHTKSCGVCSRSESNMGRGLIDITGQVFGYWTVLGISRSLVQPNGRRVTLWRCKCKCGVIREIRAGTLKRGLSYSCGCHKSGVLREKAKSGFGISKTELLVSQFLSQNGFYYESQKIYPDLRGDTGYPLSYDFLIYVDFNPVLLIECQGRQHYEPVEFFGGEERFVIQQKNDEYKRRYAKKLGIELLEIPYTCSSEDEIVQLIKSSL